MSKVVSLVAALALPIFSLSPEYQIKTVVVRPIETYPARVTLEGITIAADPYPTDEKSFTAFDVKDLNSRGYFPIHIIIQNATSNYITVRTRNITLSTNTGQELYTTSAALVVDDVIKGSLLSNLPRMRSRDLSTSTKAGSPLADFTGKELTNRQVEPGTTSDGFVFFYTPEPKKPLFNGSKLVIPQVVDEGPRKPMGPFSIPLDPALTGASAK